MVIVSAEEKARRRAEALKRLQATRDRLAAKPGGGAGTNSGPNGTNSSSGAAGSHSGSAGGSNVTRPSGASNVPNTSSSVPNGGSNGTSSNGPSGPPIETSNRTNKRQSGLLARPYIEYDMSTLKDTKAGFLVPEDAPADRWLERLPQQIPILPLDHPDAPSCFECGNKEIDFRLFNIFKTRICSQCRKNNPEKYSMLTKTECKADYLLTEPELADDEILPHMERPNPHQETYSNMMLYMRYQAEEFAFKKWGGEKGLDAEYERRKEGKIERKKRRFEAKIKEIRNKTRAQAITRTNFDRHTHTWSEPELQDDGTSVKQCACGMKINVVVMESA